MTPEVAGWIAWGLVALMFLLFGAWVIGYIAGRRRPCSECTARDVITLAGHQVAAQAKAVRAQDEWKPSVRYTLAGLRACCGTRPFYTPHHPTCAQLLKPEVP